MAPDYTVRHEDWYLVDAENTPTFPHGEEVFDCPDCPTVLYEDSALYGSRSCEECRLHSQGALSLEELKERKETHDD